MARSRIIPRLPDRKGHVAVLDHVLNLPPHRQAEQDDEVDHQDRPEDGHVEDLAPAAAEGQADGPRGRVPELELGEPPDEGAEFLLGFGGQGGLAAVLERFVLAEGGVEFGLEEGEEEVEEVDAERVADWGRVGNGQQAPGA